MRKFGSTVGFESLMVRTVCSGMMPFKNNIELAWQVLTMGLFRIAVAVFLKKCDKIVNSCSEEKEKSKKE